jgi:serine protease Do
VKRVVDRLRTDGHVLRSHTGLTLRPLVDYIHNTFFPGERGVIVDDVAPGSPAEKAGVAKGDRLLRVGTHDTNGRYREDLPEIRWTLADLPDGRPAELEVERDGKTVTLSLTPDLCEGCDGLGFDAARWNATFQAVSRERVPDLAFHRASGVYVLGVKFPGNAADAGLRENDLILTVDRKPVADLGALSVAYQRSIDDGRPRKVALLEILREGRRTFLALDLERDLRGDR